MKWILLVKCSSQMPWFLNSILLGKTWLKRYDPAKLLWASRSGHINILRLQYFYGAFSLKRKCSVWSEWKSVWVCDAHTDFHGFLHRHRPQQLLQPCSQWATSSSHTGLSKGCSPSQARHWRGKLQLLSPQVPWDMRQATAVGDNVLPQPEHEAGPSASGWDYRWLFPAHSLSAHWELPLSLPVSNTVLKLGLLRNAKSCSCS